MKEPVGVSDRKAGRAGHIAGSIILLLVVGFVVLVWLTRPLLLSATASVSHSLCAAAFVSGLDPEQVYREEQLPEGGMSKIAWALHYAIDRQRREVRTTAFGRFASRAIYREGFGCHLVQGDAPDAIDRAVASADDVSTPAPALAEAIDPRLSPTLDAAFAEVDARELRQTKAIVVLQDGKLIAERYASGYSADTPIWAHSLTKSVTSALIGILVRDGKLRVDQSAQVASWQTPGDPRRSITVDQLLRMTAGLPFDETSDTLNLATQLFMREPDGAAFAARQPLVAAPGQQWGYSNLSYALLSRVMRDAVGGDPGDTRAFMRRELFGPLGMRHSLIEFDAAGTPVGAGFMVATARDCARFGQLYLDDGVVDGRRLLPEGWVDYSAKQSLPSSGYGAGFWTNRKRDGEIPYWGIEWGLSRLPDDTYFARGYLGQFIVIVPSARLVVVRMGLSHDTSPGVNTLVALILDVLKIPAATHSEVSH